MADLICKPTKIYLVLSIIVFIVLIFQNYGNLDYYCLGKLQCDAPDLTLIFVIKVLYIIFWSSVIQIFCDNQQVTIAWLFVLYPIILYVILFIDLADG